MTQTSRPLPANQPATRSAQSSPVHVEPVGEELHRAALGQQILRGAGQFRADGVAGPAGVAVGVRRDARSGHERRVADDEIEAFAADRFGQVALAEIPVQTGQRGRRRGEAERARRQIGRGDPLRVRGQVQSLHAAAGTEVERTADRRPDHRVGERGGRVADAEHVVRPQRSRSAARWQVGHHPPGIAVRLQIQAGP